MTGDLTRSGRVTEATASDVVVCPVCGIEGADSGRGLRNHLVFDHGWDEGRVPTGSRLDPGTAAGDPPDSTE